MMENETELKQALISFLQIKYVRKALNQDDMYLPEILSGIGFCFSLAYHESLI